MAGNFINGVAVSGKLPDVAKTLAARAMFSKDGIRAIFSGKYRSKLHVALKPGMMHNISKAQFFHMLPKNSGRTLETYVSYPITSEKNINDQVLGLTGATLTKNVWYAYDANDKMISGSTHGGFATEALAWAASGAKRVVLGGGRLYGESTDMARIVSELPNIDPEVGGLVNEVRISVDKIKAEVKAYGCFTKYSKEDINVNNFGTSETKNLFEEKMRRMGELGYDILEKLTQTTLIEAAHSHFPGAATAMGDVDENAIISYKTIKRVENELRKWGAEARVTPMIASHINTGTVPVKPYYVAFVSGELGTTLESLKTLDGAATSQSELAFKPVATYAASAGIVSPLEIGMISETRIISLYDLPAYKGKGKATASTAIMTTGGNADVYPMVWVSGEAFASLTLEGGEEVEIIDSDPSTMGSVDPYHRVGKMAIMMNEGILIRKPYLLHKILTSCTI